MEATSRPSRRAIIAAGLGGLAAAVAQAVGRPQPAQAGHNATNVLHLGEINQNPAGFITVLAGNNVEPTLSSINTGPGPALGIGGTVHIGANVNNGTALSILNANTGAGASGLGVQTAGGEPAIDGVCDGTGIGVQGRSDDPVPGGPGGPGIGVHGLSGSGIGVRGHSGSGTGVHGHSGSGTGVVGDTGTGLGIEGASDSGGGVWGHSVFGVGVHGSSWDGGGVVGAGGAIQGSAPLSPPGPGVIGIAPGDAPGVRAQSMDLVTGDPDGGLALEVIGKARFSTAGAGVIKKNVNADFIANLAVTAQSHVSVTLTGNPGQRQVRWVERVPGSGFTVHLSAPLSGGRPTTTFTYLIVEPGG